MHREVAHPRHAAHARLRKYLCGSVRHPATISPPRLAADDILAVLDHIGTPKAHIVGLSMGGFATLHFGVCRPHRARSLCIGGCGYGAEPDKRDAFRAEADVIANTIRKRGHERLC